MSRFVVMGLVVAAFLLGAAVSGSGGQPMQITSSAFPDGGTIPSRYVMPGAGGQNVSVPLSWSGAPANTQSFALAMVDPHPIARNWVHWLVIDLPKESTSLPEGASGHRMPPGAVELQNSFGAMGYGGPQPPRGSGDHPYVFTLYALSVPKISMGRGAGLVSFQQALEGKTLGTASLTGYFGR